MLTKIRDPRIFASPRSAHVLRPTHALSAIFTTTRPRKNRRNALETSYYSRLLMPQMATEFTSDLADSPAGSTLASSQIDDYVLVDNPSDYLDASLPPAPGIFFGRSEYVESAINRILETPSPRFALLGPGGMGKTATALTILHSARIAQRYGQRRYWVPCEQATSSSLLIELISRNLHIGASNGSDLLDDIIQHLTRDDQPHMFVLDNFETVRDIDKEQSRIEDILSSIANVSNTTLLLTMRGSELPSSKLQWSSPPLLPIGSLSLEASRQTFIELNPTTEEGNDLDALLLALDGMPLAVTLMAKVARLGETPAMLLSRWREQEATGVIDLGSDRLSSVEVSIRTSLEFPEMKANESALSLLSILSMLPGGAQPYMIPLLCPQLNSTAGALATLLRISLVDSASTGTIHILSPIRQYMLRHHPPPLPAILALHQAYYDLIASNHWSIGDEKSGSGRQILEQEAPNIEFVLMDGLKRGDKAAATQATVLYADHQYWAAPKGHVLQAVCDHLREDATKARLLATASFKLGKMQWVLSQYPEAVKTLSEAREIAIAVDDPACAAQALWTIGDIAYLQNRYDEAQIKFEGARKEFLEIEDTLGATQSLHILGRIYHRQGQLSEAREAQLEAQKEFWRLGDRFGSAQCVQCLGRLEHDIGHWDAAITATKEACAEFEALGDHRGVSQCSNTLAELYTKQGRLDEAWTARYAAFEGFERIGNVRGTGQALRGMAEIRLKQGRFEEARNTLEKAQNTSQSVGDQLNVNYCFQALGQLEVREGAFGQARLSLKRALKGFEGIGTRPAAARTLQLIADLELEAGRPDKAREHFILAKEEFLGLKLTEEAAGCEAALAQLPPPSDWLSSNSWIGLLCRYVKRSLWL